VTLTIPSTFVDSLFGLRLWFSFTLEDHHRLGTQTRRAFIFMATSKLQKSVASVLRLSLGNAQLLENYRPKWLTDQKGRRLELDFFLPDHHIAIEVQGEQHFQYSPHFHSDYSEFVEQKQRDENKRILCLSLGIRLIEVIEVEDIKIVWALLQEKANFITKRKRERCFRERAVNIITTDKVAKFVSYFDAAMASESILLIQWTYVRAKSFFRSHFDGPHVNKCDPLIFGRFQSLSEKARKILTESKSELPATVLKRGAALRQVELLNKKSNPDLPKSRVRKRRGAPRKVWRSKRLSLENLSGDHFLVYGGQQPHRVLSLHGTFICDCSAYLDATDNICSHIYRVMVERELRLQEKSLLANY